VDLPPDHRRYSPIPDLDDEGFMPPPWAKYPNIRYGSVGWHMGFGEEYWLRFAHWYEAQPASVRDRVRDKYPEPPGWAGAWARAFGRGSAAEPGAAADRAGGSGLHGA
jgi:hypothetical protein